jgi:hypothetical protein
MQSTGGEADLDAALGLTREDENALDAEPELDDADGV